MSVGPAPLGWCLREGHISEIGLLSILAVYHASPLGIAA
jgi:hypothetical protein